MEQEKSASQFEELVPCLFVTAKSLRDRHDQLDDFLRTSSWRHSIDSSDSRYASTSHKVNSMDEGQAIAVLDPFIKNKELTEPTQHRFNVSRVLRATGIITANPRDGRSLEVEWTRSDAHPEWQHHNWWHPVRKVTPGGWKNDELLHFALHGKPQDVTRFRLDLLDHQIISDRYVRDTLLEYLFKKAKVDSSSDWDQFIAAETNLLDIEKLLALFMKNWASALSGIADGAPLSHAEILLSIKKGIIHSGLSGEDLLSYIDAASRLCRALGDEEKARTLLILKGRIFLDDNSASQDLTERELQTAMYVAEGFKNEQIGEHMNLSPRTVEDYISSAIEKLKLKNKAHLAAWAGYHKLVAL